MKLMLDRNHIRNEYGEVVASVPHTLGDDSDPAMGWLLVGAVNLLPELLDALREYHQSADRKPFHVGYTHNELLLASGETLLAEVSMNQNE